MKALGVTDHRFLGGFGTYRDSGMKWHEDGHAVAADEVHDNAFWHADLTEAADHLVEVIREVRPQVLVTYDQFGGYGHPDHIQAHRVAMYAAHARRRAVVPPRPRRGLGHRQDLLGRDVGEPDARGPAGAARGRRHHQLRGHGPRRPDCRSSRSRTTTSARPSTRSEYVDQQDGRAARRTPPRSPPTGRSSRCPTTSATTSGAPSSTAWSRASQGPVARERPRGPTCSPGSDEVARGRLLLLVAGAATALAAVLLHQSGGASCSRPPRPSPRWWRWAAGWLTRLPFALGWVALVAWMAPQRAEGDFVDRLRPRRLRPARRSRCCVLRRSRSVTLPRPRRVRSDERGDGLLG